MGTICKRQLNAAKKLLERYGYTVLPPEETEVRTADFESFWEAYQKKVEKDKCIRIWAKMTKAEKEACMNAVPVYVASTPDRTYRKNPSTYLHNKCWKDEVYFRDNADSQRQQRLSQSAALVAKYAEADM